MTFAPANLDKLAAEYASAGPAWALESEDLDLTFLCWPEGHEIARHVNDEVDVAMIVVTGRGLVSLDTEQVEVGEGDVMLIPKGVSRSIKALAESFCYLNIHKRRRKLMPTTGGGYPRSAKIE